MIYLLCILFNELLCEIRGAECFWPMEKEREESETLRLFNLGGPHLYVPVAASNTLHAVSIWRQVKGSTITCGIVLV